MNAEGVVFLSRTRPLAGNAADGTFQLTVMAMDRIATHQVEPWRITWAGEEARAFWTRHQHTLTPGQPLQVQIERLKPIAPRHCAAEIHAIARHIDLAPRNHECSAHKSTHQPEAAQA